MFYKKNQSKVLDDALFQNPTAEYRGTPFWAWNDKLDKEDLLWQIEQLKKMGFGGFHMHSRSGMATPYLSEEFMDLIRACTEKAKAEEMLSYLYDEDRWPSGAAGGIVTKNKKHRQKTLRFRPEPIAEAETGTAYLPEDLDFAARKALIESCAAEGKTYLLATFDVALDGEGKLAFARLIAPEAAATGNKWYAYVVTAENRGWMNGQAYVDTLSKEAIAEFIRVTYLAYKDAVGDEFGNTVPSIFTDEPQFAKSDPLPFATDLREVRLPWTTTLPESFLAAYGFDIVPLLPTIFWDKASGEPARERYLFRDHTCQLFTEAFADQCGKWCMENGIALTGHVMEERSLRSQTHALGEAMRTYRNFGIPGIDMLCDATEFSTAKQCQSAVRQYGREAMLSELYGVTGWQFDFRGHKFQGDWQAALGVTLRVPHLSWVSMKGSAKRDYPASISYQSAWYKEYKYIEDHFARVNTALTRGTPAVQVGVIHPIESYWLNYGPSINTAGRREQLQNDFDNVIDWLLRGTVDFDFVCESLLPEQYSATDDKSLAVGVMRYKAIVVPPVETLRGSTVSILSEFVKKGGKLIVMGNAPKLVDAIRSDAAGALWEQSIRVPSGELELLNALEEEREVRVVSGSGTPCKDYIYQKRIDGDYEWVFLCRAARPPQSGFSIDEAGAPKTVHFYFKGKKRPVLYDTLSGEIREIAYSVKEGTTEVVCEMYTYDSLLLRLEDTDVMSYAPERVVKKPTYVTDIKEKVRFALSEPNVLVLDMPEWSEDGEHWQPREEMLRIDDKLRAKYKLPRADGHDVQPWVLRETEAALHPYLKFTFSSTVAAPCKLAFEEADRVWFNGREVKLQKDGYFADKRIFTAKLPDLKRGKNELIIRAPLGKRTSLENYFLLGDFGVKVDGCEASVTAMPRSIGFGPITDKSMPFYGAALTYKIPLKVKDCDIAVSVERYTGALVTAKLDGKDVGRIVFAPYRLEIEGLPAGEHLLELTLYNTRVNSFSALHCCGNIDWKGPGYWYTKGKDFSYEYQLFQNGILKSPVIEVFEKE